MSEKNTNATTKKKDISPEIMQKVLTGDLRTLTPTERVEYYNHVCESVGLNPLTKPFDYITLNGKVQLYAKKDATDQLRAVNNISVKILERESRDGLYIVVAQAIDKTGRIDESLAAVTTQNFKGDQLANALMKCETKAKRRVTLSIVGLGWLDETELETINPADMQRAVFPEDEKPEKISKAAKVEKVEAEKAEKQEEKPAEAEKAEKAEKQEKQKEQKSAKKSEQNENASYIVRAFKETKGKEGKSLLKVLVTKDENDPIGATCYCLKEPDIEVLNSNKEACPNLFITGIMEEKMGLPVIKDIKVA